MGLPGWPGGDPGAIKDASKAWYAFHDAILQVIDAAEPSMKACFKDWEGKASTEFESTWNDFVKTHRTAAKGAHSVGKQLEDFGEKLEEAHKKYEHMVEAMAATAVVGFGLALFTGGLSAMAGTAAEAAVASEVAALLVELGVELETAVTVATAAAEAAGGAAEMAVGAAVNFTIGFGLSAGDQALESELDGEGFKVKWDQAALAGLTTAALGPLMDGKTLPVRVAIGAGGNVLAGALSQLDDLLLHGGLKDGESFDPKTLIVDLLAGALQGKIAEGPELAAADGDLQQLEAMVEDLGNNPDVAALLAKDPDWLDIYSTDPEIMRIIAATEKQDASFAVSPSGVTAVLNDIQHVVIDVKAPASLATYTKQAVARRLLETGTDLAKEDIKKVMEFEMKDAGGPKAVAQMNPEQLKQLADKIAASIPKTPLPKRYANAR